MLSGSELAFLEAVGGGESARAYALRHNYSPDWAKWKSRQIRRKLGVTTIREAVQVSQQEQEGVSRADFDKLTGLVSKLGDAIEELGKRPNDAPAQERVRERELDLKDHAKALGLSLDDVEKLKGEREYERFKSMQERLERERDEAELDDDDGGDGDGEENGSAGTRILDGLGGIRNVVRPKP